MPHIQQTIFHKLVLDPEAVTLQSGVIYGRQLRVCKTSVNGQMTLFPCAATVCLLKEWIRLYRKYCALITQDTTGVYDPDLNLLMEYFICWIKTWRN